MTMNSTKATMRKFSVSVRKLPQANTAPCFFAAARLVAVTDFDMPVKELEKSRPPVIAPMIGMMMSPTSEVTMAPKAAPMMTPTARSTTLPFIANSRNSFSMLRPPSRGSDEALGGLVDQACMHHGVADHLAGWRRHVHQWQAHFFFEPLQQFEAMLGSRQAGLLEDGIMQRRQAVLDFQSGRVITLHDS